MKTSSCYIYSVSLCGLVVLESNQRSIINMVGNFSFVVKSPMALWRWPSPHHSKSLGWLFWLWTSSFVFSHHSPTVPCCSIPFQQRFPGLPCYEDRVPEAEGTAIISPERYLCGCSGSCAAPSSPHLLKLYSDFCKGLNDDGNKHILKGNANHI